MPPSPPPPPGQTNKWQSAVCQLSLQSFVFRNVIFATQALHSFGGHVLPRLLKIDVGRTGLLEFLFGNIFSSAKQLQTQYLLGANLFQFICVKEIAVLSKSATKFQEKFQKSFSFLQLNFDRYYGFENGHLGKQMITGVFPISPPNPYRPSFSLAF